MRRPSLDPTTAILAFLGSLALGFTAMIDAVIAAVLLFTGDLLGAVGDPTATHDATNAKILAISVAVLAALEFGAGEFLRRRIRTMLVPIAAAATVAAELALSIWSDHFGALAAIMIGCAVFATWTWWRLPRAEEVGVTIYVSDSIS